MNIFTAARRLASLLTDFDSKQTSKASYNRNALPLYLQAVHAWEADKDTAANPARTLARYFTTNPAGAFCLAPVRKFAKEISAAE